MFDDKPSDAVKELTSVAAAGATTGAAIGGPVGAVIGATTATLVDCVVHIAQGTIINHKTINTAFLVYVSQSVPSYLFMIPFKNLLK
ncbi:unnamed protein product [Adineta steineri]|uniref:Uncharacterized protein n=1 Tax=Adineta steineri TaxID=433720 RepID=A0A819J420_9BILA|nr:unnamed protein product [Adineta steineri]